jgi:hypothetical protein
MRFGERLLLFIFRPLYRSFVERPIWWFLAKVKVFFFAEVGPQLESIGRQLEDQRQRLTHMERQIQAIEDGNIAQWDALEQLLLALYRQPGSEATTALPASEWTANERTRVHASGNLR